MPDLRLESVTHRFGRDNVLSGISCSATTGSTTVLLGASGSGKSTILGIISGVLRPSSGKVWLGKKDLTGIPAHKRGLPMVFQEPLLFPHLSVHGNITFGLNRRQKSTIQLDTVLEAFDLSGLGQRLPSQLSGGQKQRVALARALVLQPCFVLLDEPFSALNGQLKAEMHQYLQEQQRTNGCGVILVSHDPAEAMKLGDHLILIDKGKILQQGLPTHVYQRPVNATAARLTGPCTIVSGKWSDKRFYTGSASITLPHYPARSDDLLILRPHHLRLRHPDSQGLKAKIISHYPQAGDVAFLAETPLGNLEGQVPAREFYTAMQQRTSEAEIILSIDVPAPESEVR